MCHDECVRHLTSTSLLSLTFAVSLTATVASTPSTACTIRVPGFSEENFPFDGKVVPRNAQLRFDTFQLGTLVGITGPDGPVEGSILHDEGRFAVPELVPGPWEIVVADSEREGAPTRTIAFDVVDEIDTTAPAAPEVAGRRVTRGSQFLPPRRGGHRCDLRGGRRSLRRHGPPAQRLRRWGERPRRAPQ